MNLKILYEDNHYLIVDKPSMLITQKAEGHEDSLEQRACHYIKNQYQKPGAVFLHAAHRLDKEVSGIVVFAKTSKGLERFNELLRNKKVKKVYFAKVEGLLKEKQKVLNSFICKTEHKALICESAKEGYKSCSLSYQVLKEERGHSFIEIDLDTGRYHQIRAQLSSIGHPVIGDKKYGSVKAFIQGGIALSHAHLEFVHPIKQNLISISCSLDFS